jgi:hypothetical protein
MGPMKWFLVAAAATCIGAASSPVLAHTEPDLIAVPAGSAATVRLKPTHGCGESPTVLVRIRAPFPDATAGDVEGWSATATPDGAGNTVLAWSGGVLPADEDGAFPVQFTAPDAVGTLLTFPAIQVCENGEELAWISGNPADEYPAPRVLVLPPGSEPAATLDEVPLDAPGRDQLVAVVDVDNPNATTTTTAPTTTAVPTTTSAPATTTSEPAITAPETTAPETSTPASSAPPTTAGDDDGEGGTAVGPIAIAGGAVVAVGAGAAIVARRRPR